MVTFKIPDITTAKYGTNIYTRQPTKLIKMSTIWKHIYSLSNDNYNSNAHIKLQ
jgi:hypothetical protein